MLRGIVGIIFSVALHNTFKVRLVAAQITFPCFDRFQMIKHSNKILSACHFDDGRWEDLYEYFEFILSVYDNTIYDVVTTIRDN